MLIWCDCGQHQGHIRIQSILEFHGRLGKLSERERAAMLRTFDELIPQIPADSAAAANREVAELLRARKAGGRRACLEQR